jgi:hypothetical protein
MNKNQYRRLLFLCGVLILSQTMLKAQWYSYDGFEKRTKAAKAPVMGNPASPPAAKNVIDSFIEQSEHRFFDSKASALVKSFNAGEKNTTIFKSLDETLQKLQMESNAGKDAPGGKRISRMNDLLRKIKKEKKRIIDLMEDSIVKIYEQQILETDEAKRKELKVLSEKLNEELLILYSDRGLENQVKLQIDRFKYAKTRAPGVFPFPAGFRSASFAFFDNSDTIILTKEDVFQFEHAYLNYLTGTQKIAAYTEPLFDHIGPVRVSLGLLALAPSSKDSVVTTKKSDSLWKQKIFASKFRSGGGIAQLNFMYPLLHAHDNKYIDFKLYASPRFAIDVPREDTSVQRFAHHTQMGVEAQLKINTFEGNFNFLLCFRGMQVWGNSTFMDNMGFTGSQRKSFNFNTWTVGFIAKKHLALYYTWYSGDSRAINKAPAVTNNSITANYQF